MKNLTRQFRRMMVENERNFLAYADITLSNNTVINLTNSELWSGGFSYEEAVSSDDEFTAIGSVIIGSAEIIINNIYEEYSEYDFTNADVVLYLGMQLEDRLEKFKIGTYRVDDTAYNGATIKLSLLDNIEQFDRPYSLSNLGYPATLFQIIQDACITCGITLANNSLTFPHYNYSIPTRPNDESITFRQVLSWCATIAGQFIKCNPDGELTLGWFNTALLDDSANDLDGGTFNPWSDGTVYDGGTFNPWSDGTVYDGGDFSTDRNVHYITNLWSQNIAMDDVVITGVTAYVKDESETASRDIKSYSTGTSGYVIEISDNDFITTTNAQEIVNWLGVQLIGLRFRKLNVSQLSDPAIESGDVGIVVDRKSNVYRALITRVAFTIGSSQTIICGASTPSRNNSTKYSSVTKSYVESRKMLRREQSAREQAVEQLERAIEESSGLYTTIVTPQTGGNIYYLHDAPDLADAKVVWKMTSDAWAVTDDWQGTDAATTDAHKWNAGLTVDGTLLTNVINTIGAFFDYAHGGTIKLGGVNNGNGILEIYNAYGTRIGRWDNEKLYIGNIASNLTAPNTSIDAGGAIATKSLTAKDYVYVDGNSRSYLNIPMRTSDQYVRISNNGFYMRDDYGNDVFMPISDGNNTGLRIRPTNYSLGQEGVHLAPYNMRIYSSDLNQSFTANYRYIALYKVVGSSSRRIFIAFANGNGTDTPSGDGVEIYGRLSVSGGTKNRIVETEHYSKRTLTCYEMPSPMFGDIGEGIIGDDGLCYISLDPIFLETISNCVYQVFLQKYGSGECFILERKSTYFVVSGEPNLKFAWEIKAKQIDFDQERLPIHNSGTATEDTNEKKIDYGGEALKHIRAIANERSIIND